MADRKIKVLKYTAIFEPAEEGGFTVTIPSLPGCVTEGDTFEEAVKMAKDAIKCYLASLTKHKESIPEESPREFIGTIDVSMPLSCLSAKKAD